MPDLVKELEYMTIRLVQNILAIISKGCVRRSAVDAVNGFGSWLLRILFFAVTVRYMTVLVNGDRC